MSTNPLTPRAIREAREAAAWIAKDNLPAARDFRTAVLDAARRIIARPMLAHARLALAGPRYRFWSLRGFPYLLVLDTARDPPVIARVLHQARDLPVALEDLQA